MIRGRNQSGVMNILRLLNIAQHSRQETVHIIILKGNKPVWKNQPPKPVEPPELTNAWYLWRNFDLIWPKIDKKIFRRMRNKGWIVEVNCEWTCSKAGQDKLKPEQSYRSKRYRNRRVRSKNIQSLYRRKKADKARKEAFWAEWESKHNSSPPPEPVRKEMKHTTIKHVGYCRQCEKAKTRKMMEES